MRTIDIIGPECVAVVAHMQCVINSGIFIQLHLQIYLFLLCCMFLFFFIYVSYLFIYLFIYFGGYVLVVVIAAKTQHCPYLTGLNPFSRYCWKIFDVLVQNHGLTSSS